MRKGRTVRDIPPPLELECLCALWSLGEGTVQAVRDKLTPHKPLAYTTVMTMLERLTRKQVIGRHKLGRSFVYAPLVSRDEIRKAAVRELVESLFDGDQAQLSAYLRGEAVVVEEAAEADGSGALDAALL